MTEINSAKEKTFREQFLNGECSIDKIDDFIDDWHDGDSTLPLSEYLGLTEKEYFSFVEKDEQALAEILIPTLSN